MAVETKRPILEKMVMRKNWGHNHIDEDDVSRGLPKNYSREWYHYVKHELKRKGWLIAHREHGKNLHVLNIKRKREIEHVVGSKVAPP